MSERGKGKVTEERGSEWVNERREKMIEEGVREKWGGRKVIDRKSGLAREGGKGNGYSRESEREGWGKVIEDREWVRDGRERKGDRR